MPVISGIDPETKQKLIDYCKRKGVTQLDWVAKHLLEDIKREEVQRSNTKLQMNSIYGTLNKTTLEDVLDPRD